MSSRNLGRRPTRRAHTHLVLVRGGLDASTDSAVAKDWRAFCERIGWQSGETTLPDDYEDRLAERIFGDAPLAAEPVRASWIAPTARATPRSTSKAPVALLVAALIGVAAAAVIPLLVQSRPPVSASPDPATTRANGPSPEPTGPEPERAVSEEPDAPQPGPELVGPKPNGSRLARVARARGPARPAGRASGKVAPPAPEERIALERPDPHDSREREAYSDVTPISAPAPALTWIGQPATLAWRAPVSAQIAASASVASWSLSPAGDRWYGASLPPSTDPIDAANAGAIGVMAKVDLAKLGGF